MLHSPRMPSIGGPMERVTVILQEVSLRAGCGLYPAGPTSATTQWLPAVVASVSDWMVRDTRERYNESKQSVGRKTA